MNNGELSVLSVGTGDTTLSFDVNNPQDRARSAKLLTDMMRKGYTVFVKIGEDSKGPLYRRVSEFDPEHCEYMITGEGLETADVAEQSAELALTMTGAKAKKRGKKIKAEDTHAVAVRRTAGG